MKLLLRCIATVALVLFTFSLYADSSTDAQTAKKLIGSWVLPPNFSPAIKKGGKEFRSDGTFTSFGIILITGQEVRVDVEGKWKIENGVLMEEIVKSTNEKMFPIGAVTRDTVIQVNEKEYRYRTEKGKESFRLRKTEG